MFSIRETMNILQKNTSMLKRAEHSANQSKNGIH